MDWLADVLAAPRGSGATAPDQRSEEAWASLVDLQNRLYCEAADGADLYARLVAYADAPPVS